MIDSRPWGYEGVDSTTIWAVEVVILVLRLVVAQWGEITRNSVDQIPPSIDWLVVSIHLKNMSSSIGMMTFPIYGKIKLMFQTTNQIEDGFWKMCIVLPGLLGIPIVRAVRDASSNKTGCGAEIFFRGEEQNPSLGRDPL